MNAIRPDIAGIMGAFGAALIARERYVDCEGTTMLSIDRQSIALEYSTTMTKCQWMYKQLPSDDQPVSVADVSIITGNRCERGLGKEKSKKSDAKPI